MTSVSAPRQGLPHGAPAGVAAQVEWWLPRELARIVDDYSTWWFDLGATRIDFKQREDAFLCCDVARWWTDWPRIISIASPGRTGAWATGTFLPVVGEHGGIFRAEFCVGASRLADPGRSMELPLVQVGWVPYPPQGPRMWMEEHLGAVTIESSRISGLQCHVGDFDRPFNKRGLAEFAERFTEGDIITTIYDATLGTMGFSLPRGKGPLTVPHGEPEDTHPIFDDSLSQAADARFPCSRWSPAQPCAGCASACHAGAGARPPTPPPVTAPYPKGRPRSTDRNAQTISPDVGAQTMSPDLGAQTISPDLGTQTESPDLETQTHPTALGAQSRPVRARGPRLHTCGKWAVVSGHPPGERRVLCVALANLEDHSPTLSLVPPSG
jgi:hypothetical protein